MKLERSNTILVLLHQLSASLANIAPDEAALLAFKSHISSSSEVNNNNVVLQSN